MCGRFTLKTPASKLAGIFEWNGFSQLSPRYNIAPTQLVVCVRTLKRKSGENNAGLLRWGLIPDWAPTATTMPALFNARSETAAEKPAFRKAFRSRRCLIPADGFFEWKALNERSKQPWYIRQPDDGVFCFAGLWETWRDPGSGQAIESCTILTTQANDDLAELHERMPVILLASAYATWLSNSPSPGQLQELMQPLSAGSLVCHPVSSLVNKVSNNSPECIQHNETERNAAKPPNQQRTLFD